jgi:hypothetical protein
MTDFGIMDVHFDPKRSEFWGSAWREPPRLWSWSEGRGLRTVPVRARRIYATFLSEDGRRVIAATLSTAVSPDEVDAAFVALGTWDGDRVQFRRVAPSPAHEASDGVVVLGDDALFGYLVDTLSGMPVIPSVESALYGMVFVRAPRTDRWLRADPGTLRVSASSDGAKTWTSLGEISAPPPGHQFSVTGLHSDPYRSHIYAVVRGAGAFSAWLSRSSDGGRTWDRFGDSAWYRPLFDAEGVWLQAREPAMDQWAIALELRNPEGGAGRRITLRVPETP